MNQNTRLTIQGMRCAGCVKHVEDAIARLAGVRQVAVNLALGQAEVEHDPSAAPADSLVAAVKALGFEAQAILPAQADSSGDAHGPASGALVESTEESLVWRSWLDRLARWPGVIGIWLLASVVALLGMSGHGSLAGDWVHGPVSRWIQLILTLVVMGVLGRPFYAGAWRGLRHRRVDMDTLVSLGTLVALGYSLAGMFFPLGHGTAGGAGRAGGGGLL